MNSKLLFVVIFTVLSATAFAQNRGELEKRLNFVNGEIDKIQKRIENGQDPQLFKKYLKNFKAEKNELNKKLAATEATVAPVKTKKVNKKVKTPKVKSKTAKSLVGNKLLPSVRLTSKVPLGLVEIESLLRSERESYLSLLGRGVTGNRIRQAEVNIAYLELQKSKGLSVETQAKAPKTSPKELSKFSYKGHFQLRSESATNQQGVQDRRQTEQSFYRLRTYFTFSPNEKLDFNYTPQTTKGFGADEGGVPTSGSTNHSDVSFFEANINYNISSRLSAKLGRQELDYGDHLIIGSLPWANTGRSFDALKFRFSHWKGGSDIFYSKISNDGSALTASDDTDLFTIYNSYTINQYLKPLDLYFIREVDDSAGGVNINTFGLRVKGQVGAFFYRTENGVQAGAKLGDDAFQYNLELGAQLNSYSASLEYSLAGADYRQLYPTAHKFLGIADVLGRRNLRHYALHLKGAPTDWLTITADYHIFQRNDTDESAYRLNGMSAWGTEGSADEIGDEVDLVAVFNTSDNIKFQLGAALFNPGQYMIDNELNTRDDKVEFLYGQVNASF